MRAAIYTSKGPAAEVLRVVDKPVPEPAAGEVRVRVAFSGVNPSDVKSRAGVASRAGGFPEVTPHSDGAGTIDKLGAGVDAGLMGRRVWIFNGQWERPYGTAAEYIVLPVSQVVSLADDISFEVGASIAIPLMTAMHAVQSCGSLLGKTVLVPGAAGSVGFYITQLLSAARARDWHCEQRRQSQAGPEHWCGRHHQLQNRVTDRSCAGTDEWRGCRCHH